MAQTIEIRGMACEGCETTIKEALESVNGVNEVDVDRETESANIEGEPSWEDLEIAVIDAGYKVARS